MSENHMNLEGNCTAEAELARDFPDLFAWYERYPIRRPDRCEHWERSLRVARHSEPILKDIRARGLDLVRIDQYTPPGTDRRPIYQSVLEWLPRIQDPLTMTICLCRVGETEAGALLKKHRELLLRLAREWNDRLREGDREFTLAVLAGCLMSTVRERDIPEILGWVNDTSLPATVRARYIDELQRFARKPGPARDTLIALLQDNAVGGAAVSAISGALKIEALPYLRELLQSSRDKPLREIAAAAVRKIEARSLRANLPKASPALLPQGYASTSIEVDTVCLPQLLSALECELNGHLGSGIADQLSLVANQLKRGKGRFHIVPVTLKDGVVTQMGVGLYAEDEDVVFVELHFDPGFQAAVASALRHVIDQSFDMQIELDT